MEPRHRVSPVGIELIARFEGLRRRAARLPHGGYTIGYGHTRSAREGAVVDAADADALLRYDLLSVEAALNDAVYTPLTQNQFDALAAFAFSVGEDAFRGSDVLRRVNEGDLLAAAAALDGWRRAPFEGEVIVIDALIRRRAAEKALFLTPPDGFIPAPSAVLRPQSDPALQAPREAAVEIVTGLDGDAATPERTLAPERSPLPEEPSPAQAAAAAVSRRLQALFADEPSPTPAPPRDRPPELGADLALSPWADTAPVVAPTGLIEVLVTPTTPERNPANDEAQITFDDRLAGETAPAVPGGVPGPESTGPYVVLGLIGLALFSVGVWLILQGQAAGETGLFERRSGMGSVLGLIGIGAFCTGIYQWLRTLGRNGAGHA